MQNITTQASAPACKIFSTVEISLQSAAELNGLYRHLLARFPDATDQELELMYRCRVMHARAQQSIEAFDRQYGRPDGN
jgi:hypothetical protein